MFFLNKSNDPYKLIADREFSSLLSKMISPNHYKRPNVKQVSKSKFVQKWLMAYDKQMAGKCWAVVMISGARIGVLTLLKSVVKRHRNLLTEI